MKILSLFSGVGGFDRAFELVFGTGHEVYYSEIDKYAIQVYQQHFPNAVNLGDITKIDTDNLPHFDFIVGGFPCQSYSIAGNRLGLQDHRGQLIYNVFDILKKNKPKYFLLENVKGLLSQDNGRTFEFILEELCQCGYKVDFELINAALVSAQNRVRIFIFGERL